MEEGGLRAWLSLCGARHWWMTGNDKMRKMMMIKGSGKMLRGDNVLERYLADNGEGAVG